MNRRARLNEIAISGITLAQKHHDLKVAQAKQLAEICRDAGDGEILGRQVFNAAGGDYRQLRGIPVVGCGSGTSPGSDPMGELLRNSR